MIIVDPVTLGDVTFSRASSGTYFDKAGVLQTAAPNALRITYDPADLSKAPYALVEEGRTNFIRNNTMQGVAPGSLNSGPNYWGIEANGINGITRKIVSVGVDDGIEYVEIRYTGIPTASGTHQIGFESVIFANALPGQTWAASVFVSSVGNPVGVINPRMQISERTSNGGQTAAGEVQAPFSQSPLSKSRVSLLHTMKQPDTAKTSHKLIFSYVAGSMVDVTLRIGLPQLERDQVTSPIKATPVFVGRSSAAWSWDGEGILQAVPENVERVSYDPVNLSAAPFKLWESQATNFIRNNTMQGVVAGSPGSTPNYWGIEPGGKNGLVRTVMPVGVEDGIEYFEVKYAGIPTANAVHQIGFDSINFAAAATGQTWAGSVFFTVIGAAVGVADPRMEISERTEDGAQIGVGKVPISLVQSRLSQSRVELVHTIAQPDVAWVSNKLVFAYKEGVAVDLTVRIGLPQLERNQVTSPIKTAGSTAERAADRITSATVTRNADVVGPGAGLVYSNVPIIEAPYNPATSYAKDVAVYDPVTKIVYWSMQASNAGKPLSDPAWWNKRTAINRWAMFDDRNSTMTSNPEEIIAVVSARAITQGMFAGALDASEVRVSMSHPTRGLVYSEVGNLVLPRSGSSFFGWCFNRLKLRTWFLTLKLPVFANALVTITIRKPGSVARCGMCMIGPAIDVGLSLMGLSTELKDYSTTTFFPDGSSDTIPRGFSKRMSVDVSVERDRAETIEDDLIKRRQKTLVWLGSTLRGDTMLVGRFSSFRKVIDSYPRSKMALQIEGVLSQ